MLVVSRAAGADVHQRDTAIDADLPAICAAKIAEAAFVHEQKNVPGCAPSEKPMEVAAVE